MESDLVVEPARASLIPRLDRARSVAKRAGAIAVFIGGAGPTLCAICDDPKAAERVAAELESMYSNTDMNSIAQATRVERRGRARADSRIIQPISGL